ncbi:glucuronate isomerase [Fulvivirga sedimenti]|uniref:Uronate isomerase n=1 Tax=Fulvivirga sedimenti TaxID=2879465 RepID=A0A9X1HY68_9BACT|nr:glucuronate isomerase [Fulvivirga sedimenti]MCA6078697.1 glucuronate isomerase [Fulvivirga sedimenti]
MKEFLDKNFLLDSKTAEMLFHTFAEEMPIIDYHNHLSPKDIAEDKQFKNLTEAWLEGDHYKWRAMRANGIDEKFITGDAPPGDKFLKWAETVPNTLRNPLYHWTHLELRRYFGIHTLLNEKTASSVYDTAGQYLSKPEFGCRGLLKMMNVKLVCTTDDPIDDLRYHRMMDDPDLHMLPSFRPDKIFRINEKDHFENYLGALEEISDSNIHTFDDLLAALENRIRFFHDTGCRLADHGLEQLYPLNFTASDIRTIFNNARAGKSISVAEKEQFTMAVLLEVCKIYNRLGWTQQFHLGALRNNSSRMMQTLGPDTGFDSIGDFSQAKNLSAFLNSLDSTNELAQTILYNLNPRDNEVMAAMAGNFNDGTIPGKIQYGAAWWFLDQKDGIEKQLDALSNVGLLSRFIGMLTDSRSFLSFPRHEYFRRILCNLLGNEIEKGQLPDEPELVGGMIRNICFYNAVRYFSFNELK